MSVTDGDRERVVEIIRQALADEKWLSMSPYRLHVYRLAAALADEREKARAQVLALAAELEAEAETSPSRVREAALAEAADRIRRALEVTV